jgi:NAD(P)-dependent dehydrogenase (short-subunit alcohol dehydrogenase family)
VHVVTADLGDEKQCVSLIHRSTQILGGLDVLVLNHVAYAHYGDWLPVQDKASVIEKMFRVC